MRSPVTTAVDTGHLTQLLSAATRELFTSMLASDVTLALDQSALPEQFDGILSLIGLTGAMIGTGAVSCTAETACDLASRFLMTDIDCVDDSVLDAMGEITNMIIGGLKTQLEAELGCLNMSIPTVIHGKNIRASSRQAECSADLRFVYETGDFCIRISLAGSQEHSQRLRAW